MSTDTTEPNVKRFALDKIYVEGNAREDFDPGKLQELAESIKDTRGSLQPLLGTLMPDGRVKLIAGNRRLIATGMAGLTEVEVKLMPVVTRKEFLKWNLVENVQREDLKPLEKSKRIKEMLELTDEESGLPVYNRASLAHEIGLSAESIGKFENLLKAPEKVQKAVNDEGLDYTVAALIGALPVGLHDRAQKEIVFRHWGGPMKREEAQKHVATYRRDLRKAQFDQKDAELVPDAGPCEACPFFGKNRDDVDGKSRGYTCLNPECFEGKQQAHVNRVAANATEAGTQVLGQNMTDRVFQDWNNQVNPSSGYVDQKDVPDGYLLKDPKVKMPKWEKILEGAGVPVVIGFDHEGKVRRLVELKLAVEAVKHGDHADKFKTNAAANLETVDDKKHTAQISRAKNKAGAAALLEGCCELLSSFSCQRWNREVRLAFLTQICEAGHTKDDMELLCQILQPDLKSVSNPAQKLPELVELYVTTDEQLDAFILIARNIRHIRYQGFHHITHSMTAYCEWSGFDAEAWQTKSEERIKEAERAAKKAIRDKEKAIQRGKEKAAQMAKGKGKTTTAEPAEGRENEIVRTVADYNCDCCSIPIYSPPGMGAKLCRIAKGDLKCKKCGGEWENRFAGWKREGFNLINGIDEDSKVEGIASGEWNYVDCLGPTPKKKTPAHKTWEAARVKLYKAVQKLLAAKKKVHGKSANTKDYTAAATRKKTRTGLQASEPTPSLFGLPPGDEDDDDDDDGE